MLCTVLDQKSDELVFKSCSENLDINAKLWSYEMVNTLFYIAIPGLDCSSTKKLYIDKFQQIVAIFYFCLWERSGSFVECLTRDRRAAGSSLNGVTALCP